MKLDQEQAKNYKEKCKEELEIGISRPKPPDRTFEHDGGMLALPTYTPVPISHHKRHFDNFSGPSYVLNCGGTNWEGVKVDIDKGRSRISPRVSEISFSSPSRRVRESLEDFTEEIADLLYLLIGQRHRIINNLAIVLGFPQRNFKTNYGIEAKLIENQLTKGWYIKGNINKPIGRLLMKILEDKYAIHVEKVYFANDAACMMWDLSIDRDEHEEIAKIGGVWGSGINFGISIDSPRWQGHIINTEAGRSQSLLTAQDYTDYQLMRALGCQLPNAPELEIFAGGDYLFSLFTAKVLSAAVKEITLPLSLQNRLSELLEQKDTSHLLSEIIATTELDEVEEILNLRGEASNSVILKIIKQAAKEVFDNATFKMVLLLSSIIEIVDLDKDKDWVIPIEGGVINEGFGIYNNFCKLLKDTLPGYSIRLGTDGSSKKAIAILSSVLSS